MGGNPNRARRLAVALAATALAAAATPAPARAQGFFGPQTPGSLAPELDVYVRLADGVRLQAQAQPYLVPEQGYVQVTWAAYASWMAADLLRDLLSPDESKTHMVDMRAGLLYVQTIDNGTGPPGSTWTLQLDVTSRVNVSSAFLLSLRNRASCNWLVDGASGFFFRYRGRIQVEREFPIGQVPLTPYVNAEFFWQSNPGMWSQFRLQAGLQVGFDLFARGQTIEVNYVAITALQPSRSWSPQLGLILSTYF